MKSPAKNKAFTLVEILVVVAILAVLCALSMVAIQRATVTSQRMVCSQNMAKVGQAIHLFAGENNGCLPYNYAGSVGPQYVDGQRSTADVWRLAEFLAPYVSDEVWDCPDPLNIRNRQLAASRGIVWTKSSDALSTDYRDPVAKRLPQYEQPGKVDLFYCAYSPVDGPGSPGRRPWPHKGAINRLYLDGHVDVGGYKPKWPD